MNDQRVTTATVCLPQEHSNADDQHPGLSARPGQAAAHHVAHPHRARAWARSRSGCWRTDWPQHRAGRTARGQRPQAGDGRRRAADPRPHDRDVPRRPRLLAAPVPHARAGILARLAVLPSVVALGPDATQARLLQPQQGLLAAGLGSGDRAVLQPRPDAARLRRAHVPPADHAGGVRPHPAGRLRRAHRPGGLEGDRQRLGGQRPALPAPSGDEGAHARHRLDGVHGPRAGHRPASW